MVAWSMSIIVFWQYYLDFNIYFLCFEFCTISSGNESSRAQAWPNSTQARLCYRGSSSSSARSVLCHTELSSSP